jgi:hypothetical protein
LFRGVPLFRGGGERTMASDKNSGVRRPEAFGSSGAQ